MSTQKLREVFGTHDAYALKAGIIRVLTDHGINPSRPVVDDMAGYIMLLMYKGSGHSTGIIEEAQAFIVNKEVWPNDTPGSTHAHLGDVPPAHRYGARKRT